MVENHTTLTLWQTVIYPVFKVAYSGVSFTIKHVTIKNRQNQKVEVTFRISLAIPLDSEVSDNFP